MVVKQRGVLAAEAAKGVKFTDSDLGPFPWTRSDILDSRPLPQLPQSPSLPYTVRRRVLDLGLSPRPPVTDRPQYTPVHKQKKSTKIPEEARALAQLPPVTMKPAPPLLRLGLPPGIFDDPPDVPEDTSEVQEFHEDRRLTACFGEMTDVATEMARKMRILLPRKFEDRLKDEESLQDTGKAWQRAMLEEEVVVPSMISADGEILDDETIRANLQLARPAADALLKEMEDTAVQRRDQLKSLQEHWSKKIQPIMDSKKVGEMERNFLAFTEYSQHVASNCDHNYEDVEEMHQKQMESCQRFMRDLRVLLQKRRDMANATGKMDALIATEKHAQDLERQSKALELQLLLMKQEQETTMELYNRRIKEMQDSEDDLRGTIASLRNDILEQKQLASSSIVQVRNLRETVESKEKKIATMQSELQELAHAKGEAMVLQEEVKQRDVKLHKLWTEAEAWKEKFQQLQESFLEKQKNLEMAVEQREKVAGLEADKVKLDRLLEIKTYQLENEVKLRKKAEQEATLAKKRRNQAEETMNTKLTELHEAKKEIGVLKKTVMATFQKKAFAVGSLRVALGAGLAENQTNIPEPLSEEESQQLSNLLEPTVEVDAEVQCDLSCGGDGQGGLADGSVRVFGSVCFIPTQRTEGEGDEGQSNFLDERKYYAPVKEVVYVERPKTPEEPIVLDEESVFHQAASLLRGKHGDVASKVLAEFATLQQKCANAHKKIQKLEKEAEEASIARLQKSLPGGLGARAAQSRQKWMDKKKKLAEETQRKFSGGLYHTSDASSPSASLSLSMPAAGSPRQARQSSLFNDMMMSPGSPREEITELSLGRSPRLGRSARGSVRGKGGPLLLADPSRTQPSIDSSDLCVGEGETAPPSRKSSRRLGRGSSVEHERRESFVADTRRLSIDANVDLAQDPKEQEGMESDVSGGVAQGGLGVGSLKTETTGKKARQPRKLGRVERGRVTGRRRGATNLGFDTRPEADGTHTLDALSSTRTRTRTTSESSAKPTRPPHGHALPSDPHSDSDGHPNAPSPLLHSRKPRNTTAVAPANFAGNLRGDETTAAEPRPTSSIPLLGGRPDTGGDKSNLHSPSPQLYPQGENHLELPRSPNIVLKRTPSDYELQRFEESERILLDIEKHSKPRADQRFLELKAGAIKSPQATLRSPRTNRIRLSNQTGPNHSLLS